MKSTSERISSYREPRMLVIEKYNRKKKEEKEERKRIRMIEQSLIPKSKRKKQGRKKIEDPKLRFPSFRVKKSKMNELIEKYNSKSELRIKIEQLIETL